MIIESEHVDNLNSPHGYHAAIVLSCRQRAASITDIPNEDCKACTGIQKTHRHSKGFQRLYLILHV